MSLDHLYNITVDIQRPTIAQGTWGEQDKTWAAVYSNIKGRLQRKVSQESDEVGRDAVYSDYRFYCDRSFFTLL